MNTIYLIGGNFMVKTDAGYEVYFAPGRFDKWCVYLNDAENNKTIPLDKDYFQWILDLSNKYGVDQVYWFMMLPMKYSMKKSVIHYVVKLTNIMKKILLIGG